MKLDPKVDARAELHMINPAAWVMDNQFINENQRPIEFNLHRFMLQPYADCHPDQANMKSAQVGWSIKEILRSVHAAKLLRLNVIYVLPTRNAQAEFVVPKVNPMLQRNPKLAALVQRTDNKNLKQVGDRFVYFRGAFHQGEAITISGDVLVSDEYDRCNQQVLLTYQSRLQASEYGWNWRFSNPSLPSFGIHDLWQNSDQMHWLIACFACGHESYMDIEPSKYVKRPNHYIDRIRQIYACGKCGAELTNDMRQSGRWVPKYANRARRGYWVNQLMVPWVSAKKVLQQEKDMSTDVFYNFVLGLPYQASEFLINRQAIMNANHPAVADRTDVYMGCDSGKVKHWVLGNAQGVFAYGKTDDWGDIEKLLRMYSATTVIDALPDFTIPEQLARKYMGQVFVHYYQHDTKNLDVSSQKEGEQFGVIQSDRTKLFDMLAAEITGNSLHFFQDPHALDELITHFENIYRIVEEDNRGIKRARWERKPGQPDHFAHATAYYRVALGLGLRGDDAGGVKPLAINSKKPGYFVNPQTETVQVKDAMGMEFSELVERSLAPNKKRRL